MKHIFITASLLPVALIMAAASTRAEPPPPLPIETPFADADLAAVQLSPTGRYLTFLAPHKNRINLAVLDRETNKVRWLTTMSQESIVAYIWAKPDRIIFAQQFGGREQYGHFAVDPDGGNLVTINKLLRIEDDEDDSRPSGADDLPKRLVSLLPKDPDCILMNRLRGGSGLGDLVKVNLRTGRTTVEENNYINAREWIADNNGVVRLAIATDLETPIKILYRSSASAEWRSLAQFPHELSLFQAEASPVEPHWRPVVFAQDNRTLYVKSFLGHDKSAILRYDPETEKFGDVLFEHPRVEPGNRLANYRLGGLGGRAAVDGLLFTSGGDLAGISYTDEKPEVKWLDAASAKLAADLAAALPGTQNDVVSRTKDGSLMVVRAWSDRDPGEFFLYDAAKQEMKSLGRARRSINPKQMAEMRPIRFPARDGTQIPGYLTLPAGRSPKNLPMIVVPHGGPYGPRDEWGFDPQIQFLASRGYAVLQVNYRGSGGYGLEFQMGGYRQYGLRMQDDVTDGVKWCIAQGYADANRVGIFGASYGGYVVLAGLVFTPELYCCGIDYVGVADLELRSDGLRATLPKVLQESFAITQLNPIKDAEQLRATNPINFIERIQAPLLCAYGKGDPRVRFEQWQKLEDRLQRHHKTYEAVIKDNEGHGFRKPENRMEFFRKVDDFLARNMNIPEGRVKIGPAVPVLEKMSKE